MAELWHDPKQEPLWHSLISSFAGDHLTGRQKVARSLFLLIVFALMALPCLIDLLLH